MRDLAFLAGYLALFPMALASPLIAVMVVVWMSFLAPYNYLYGIANSLPLYMTSCVLMVVSSCLNPKSLTFRATPLHLLMILFLVQGAISSAASPLSVSWDMLILLSKIVFLCFMVMLVVRNRLEIHTALLVVMLGLGFHAVVEGLKTIASGGSHIVTGVPQLGDNNTFAAVMLMMAPIAFYLFKYMKVWWLRFGCLGAGLLCITATVGTLSRGAFIAMGVLGATAILRFKKRFRNSLLIVAAAGLIATLAPERWYSRIDTIESADQDTSFMGRIEAWQMSTVIALDRPLTGLGFRTMEVGNVWDSYIPQFQRLFPESKKRADQPRAHAAHSIIFQVLGDLGFVGLIIFLMILFNAFKDVYSVRRLTRMQPDKSWMYDLSGAFELTLLAYVVCGIALSVAYYESFFILISLIASLRRLALAPASQQEMVAENISTGPIAGHARP